MAADFLLGKYEIYEGGGQYGKISTGQCGKNFKKCGGKFHGPKAFIYNGLHI